MPTSAVVVAKPDAGLDEKSMLKLLDARLAKYKLPKRILFLQDLPRNSMGKVLKAELRKTYENLYKS
jgi:malonyl-CoA/methylmalonyl-CoA synthetase